MNLRVLRRLVLAATLTVGLAACTPQQIAFFTNVTAPYRDVVQDDQLQRLRTCESHDNYQAVSVSGRFRGAYQFTRGTWDGLAARHFPWLEGVDPAAAEPAWQDAMARALWSESGHDPWPVCGPKA